MSTLVPSEVTLIRFEDDRTTLGIDGVPEVVVPVGARALASRLFRHDPPTAGELERAIDEVEDALESTGLRHGARGDLRIREPRLLELLGLQAGAARVTREEVEARFQTLAAIAQGRPVLREGTPPSNETAAALLILRECTHHLGYAGVQRDDP
ncbi:MAG: hypothetical protein IT385_13640 [Deltaproteobacteria bacterium]|nr:hypothetical protein [Deltaproteobacteria bacterium]